MTSERKWARWISVGMYGLAVLFIASLFVPVSHRVLSLFLAAFAVLLMLEVFVVPSRRPRWARLIGAMLVVGFLAFFNEINRVPKQVAHWAPFAFLGALAFVRIVQDPAGWLAWRDRKPE